MTSSWSDTSVDRNNRKPLFVRRLQFHDPRHISQTNDVLENWQVQLNHGKLTLQKSSFKEIAFNTCWASHLTRLNTFKHDRCYHVFKRSSKYVESVISWSYFFLHWYPFQISYLIVHVMIINTFTVKLTSGRVLLFYSIILLLSPGDQRPPLFFVFLLRRPVALWNDMP